MPAPNAAALFRRNLATFGDRPAVRFEDRVWTHREFVEDAWRWAQLFLARRPRGPEGPAPFHVGVLMDNIPEYLLAFAGAAFAGATVVGLNPTRRGEALARDIAHTHVPFVITEDAYLPLLSELGSALGSAPPVLVVGSSLADELAQASAEDPGLDPDPSTTWALIFTSGTSDAPKAVICSQRRIMVTGTRMGIIMDITPDDVGYVCMPLFHSNAVMVGWAPSIVYGASVGLGRRFSASRWLADIRGYGATWFNYTGKPLSYVLATAEHADDADNPLRVAFGNEGSPQVVAEFSRRFGVEVIDAFGATEGGVAVNRTPDMPPGAMGLVGDNVKVVSEDGTGRPVARFSTDGRLLNPDECVGEIVNTAGVGPFEGYYNNATANERTTRNGWYWSGDLGYVDSEGYLYFAGRNAEWIRVDGENFPAAPIEAAVSRHPDVMLAAVYGVPDEQAGDQVMAAVVLREGAEFDPTSFAAWLDSQPDVGPKWRPRYVRVSAAGVLPSTATNKVLKRTLVQQKYRRDLVGEDGLYVRDRGASEYRPFGPADEAGLHAALERSGRARFWDL
jgi:fatty-acyl-CoA synthase